MNVQYTVLQAALILTITANLYINPPITFDSESRNDAFSSICGLAAFTHLFCIVNCTIVSGVLNMAYTAVDKMITYHSIRSVLITYLTVTYNRRNVRIFIIHDVFVCMPTG